MPAQELGQRVDDDIGAVIDRFEQDRRRHRIVHDERNAVLVRERGQRLDVADISCRIADAFAKDRFRSVVDQRLDSLGSIGSGKSNAHPLTWKHMGKQGVRRSVKLWNGNDVAAELG